MLGFARCRRALAIVDLQLAAVMIVTLFGGAVQLARGAEKPIYQPVGAPADPRVPAQWNRYHDHAAATVLLKQLAQTFPDLCRLESLGFSHGKREMWLLSITNSRVGKELEKPAFWIDGGIHANEIQGPEVALYTAWYLLESYGRQEFPTKLVNERVFYLVPMMSPDSRDAHMHEPNTTHSPRAGQQPNDDDRDGLVNEDKPDDLDGEGHITQMRIRDPHGRWKSHAKYPQWMIPCEPDEKGQYSLLGMEGFDNDGDGLVNEDADGSYDPNRNWPWGWQPQGVQYGAHHYPLSLAEDRMVADFVMAHSNIAGCQTYHNFGGIILRGPGEKGVTWDSADVAVYNTIGRVGEAMLPGYQYTDIANGLYPVFGGEVDWFYAMQGIYAFTNELFTPFNFFRQKPGPGDADTGETHERFNKYLLFGEGSVPWHEVDHPQFGKVEVGGFKKTWLRQPPSFLLEEECHRNMAFTLYHADQMPQVAIDAVKVEPLPGGLTQITATIANKKLTPTRAAVDVKHGISPPDRITLSGNNVQVIAGLTANNLLFDKPVEQKRKPSEIRVPTIRGMRAIYVRWIVQGTGPFQVTVRSAKGGIATSDGEGQPKP